MGFKKAVREQVWLKILLSGASGSGKSYSALRIATGIANKCGSDIAYIGTEGSRDKYYSDKFNYDLLQITEPYTTDKYIEAIEEAVNAGYKVLIIDSLSHEWKWLNEVHDKMPGNSFTNWGKLKPKHHQFMDKILTSPIHIIATARGKDDWVLEEDKNGKKVPKKVGLGAQQDKDIVYEYTVSLMIEQDTHIAHADKDNTSLFDGRYDILSEKDGVALYEWANIGEKPAVKKPTPVEEPKDDETSIQDVKKEIISVCTALGGAHNTDMMALLKTYAANCNPNSIKSLDKAQELLGKLKAMQK